jgi:hypothetical protein
LDPTAEGETADSVDAVLSKAHLDPAVMLALPALVVVAASIAMSIVCAQEESLIRGLTLIARHVPPPDLPHTRVFEPFAAAPRKAELGDVIFYNTSDGVLICSPSLVTEDVAKQVERRGLTGKPLVMVIPKPRRDTDPENNVYNFFEAVRLGNDVVSKSVTTTASLGTDMPVRVDASVIMAPTGVVGYLLKIDNRSEVDRARSACDENDLQMRATRAREEYNGHGPAYVVAMHSWVHTGAEMRRFMEVIRTAVARDQWFSVVGVLDRTVYLVARCGPRHAITFVRSATLTLGASKETWSAVVTTDPNAKLADAQRKMASVNHRLPGRRRPARAGQPR